MAQSYKKKPARGDNNPRLRRSADNIAASRRGLFQLAGVTLGLITLSACTSPFGTQNGTPSGTGFADSVLAHDLSDGQLLTHPTVMPVDQGVHELHADTQPRPASPLTQSGSPQAVIPAGTAGHAATVVKNIQLPVRMTLMQAIADAMQHNLSIKIQSYTPAISESQIVAAEAVFDPTFVGQIQYQHLDQPTPYAQTLGSPNSPVGINNEDQVNSQIGVKKLLSTGGTVSLIGSDNYQDFHSSTSLPPDINPSHTSDLALELKQPLLQGFGSQVNNAQIYIARRNQQIALSEFRAEVIKIVSRVERTYLQLAQAAADLHFEQQLVRQAKKTLLRLKNRLHMDVDSVQMNQARAAVDQAKYNLASVRKQVGDLSETLKALLNDPAIPVGPGPNIIPINKPTAVPFAYDLDQDIATALQQRGIMRRDRMAVEKAGIRRSVAENALLPKADLIAATDSSGLSPDGSFPGGFNRMISDPHIGFTVGLDLEIPIGNRAARAQLYRRRLLRRQALTQMLKDAQDIARDVASDLLNLTADWRQIHLARRRRKSAAAVLRGLEVEELSGQALDPTFLQLELNAQQDLAQAEITEAQALTSYNIDMVKFQRDQGTLLEFDRVAIAPAPVKERP